MNFFQFLRFKSWTLLIFIFSSSIVSFAKTSDEKRAILTYINGCWKEHQSVDLTKIEIENFSENKLIQFHLNLVEQELKVNTSYLSSSQYENRKACLNYLKEYISLEAFPKNNLTNFRTPIFIDDNDNFCAVGYLLKRTGKETLSRKISKENNLAYVRQMQYPELLEWATENGFTVDELAWIQPSYGPVPSRTTAPVGKGTNGTIHELSKSNDGQKLWVGGEFSSINDSVSANNIALVLEQGGQYYWYSLGTGVNGPIYAIQEFNNKIFVGGEFTQAGTNSANNIAFYDGNNWLDAGCISGVVLDLKIFNGQLYAAGDFDVCGGSNEINFAKWINGSWMPIAGLNGYVNTLTVVDSFLFLGGNFTYNNLATNIIKWNENIGFTTFSNSINNEVKTIEVYRDTVYVGCKRTSTIDSNLLLKLNVDHSWAPRQGSITNNFFDAITKEYSSFNTLGIQNDTMLIGGSFQYLNLMDNASIQNCVNAFGPINQLQWFVVNNSIEKMINFKGELIAAGSFTKGYDFKTGDSIILDHICMKKYSMTNKIENNSPIKNTFSFYPNPLSNNELTIENNIGATDFFLSNMNGVLVFSTKLQEPKSIIFLPDLITGNYILTIRNKSGLQLSQKMIKL